MRGQEWLLGPDRKKFQYQYNSTRGFTGLLRKGKDGNSKGEKEEFWIASFHRPSFFHHDAH
jgi:hypothetical protein